MGKKRSKNNRKGQYISKGVVGHSMRLRERDVAKRMMNQLDAWIAGKNVVLSRPCSYRKDGQNEKIKATDFWGPPPSATRRFTRGDDME
jgi:hypothetical protein